MYKLKNIEFQVKKGLSLDFKLTRGSKDVDRFHLERSTVLISRNA